MNNYEQQKAELEEQLEKLTVRIKTNPSDALLLQIDIGILKVDLMYIELKNELMKNTQILNDMQQQQQRQQQRNKNCNIM